MRRGAGALFLIAALVTAGCASGPRVDAALDVELAAIVADEDQQLASLSVLALRDGKVVYHRQFGSRWIDNANRANDQPADGATLYRVASISKLVTAIGVMRLVEAGVLELDRDASEYLGFALRNPNFPTVRITLRMLLSHTSSLRDEAGYFWPQGHGIRDVLVPGGALYGKGEAWSREHAPGAYFAYANLPWGVIGTIMEKATGERFDRLMQRRVVEPLRLSGGFSPADMAPAQVANIATLYRKRTGPEGKEVWNPSGPWIPQVDDYSRQPPVPRADASYAPGENGTLFGPQGNLRATAADLGRIMLMLMNGGEIEGVRILKRETVELMLRPAWSREAGGRGDDSRGRFNAWGLGVQHFTDAGGPGSGDRLVEGGGFRAVGHHGDAWGLTGFLAFDSATRNGLVMLSGGPSSDPQQRRGRYSSFHRYEERILTTLYRRAIAASPP